MKAAILAATTLVLLTTGCATNPYARFYTDYTNGVGALQNPLLVPPTGEPKVVHGTDALEDVKEMIRKGYVLVGESAFNSGAVSESLAVKHATSVGAEVVLLYSQYTETLSGSMPLTLPSTQTSYTNLSGTAYGPGGQTTLIGSGSTTTYGSRTTYIPYNVRRYDYRATFWAQQKPLPFGALFRDLTEEQRRQIQSNKGALVFIVVRGTPAFRNDILEGDVIKTINDEEVLDTKHCGEILSANRGKYVRISLIRDGQVVIKNLQLGE